MRIAVKVKRMWAGPRKRAVPGSHRIALHGAAAGLLFLTALTLTPTPTSAQEPTFPRKEALERVVRQSSPDPQEYEFQFVWKARIRAMREARRRLDAPGMSLSAGQLDAAGAALTGTIQVPVLAGAFTDVPGPFPQANYQARLFGDGAGAVSVRELYEEMSMGVFSITGTVTPWATLSRERAFYEPSAETNERYGRRYEFLTETLDAADPDMDFAQYDNDGPDGIPNSGDDDGVVDLVAFIYPTKAISCGGSGIWPHKSNYYWVKEDATGTGGLYVTDDTDLYGDPILVADYIVQSGMHCDGSSLMGSGTMAHELGHGLDLPDLYDVIAWDGSASAGIGHWGLMGSGNYQIVTSPAHLSAWSKDYLGWVDVQTVNTSQTGLTLDPIQTSAAVLRVELPQSNEHLLLSNRQALGSDEYVHGTGLLIWHIDRDLAGGISEVGNYVNANAFRKGVDLEEADGLADLDYARNRGDNGDPFPGATNNREFTARTDPSSASYAGTLCSVGIRNIEEVGETVTFDVSLGEQWNLWGDADGDGSVSAADLGPIYWYVLGYRDPGIVRAVPNGDVDEDGDVDLMDGFILHSQLAGVPVPDNRIEESEWTACDPWATPEAGADQLLGPGRTSGGLLPLSGRGSGDRLPKGR